MSPNENTCILDVNGCIYILLDVIHALQCIILDPFIPQFSLMYENKVLWVKSDEDRNVFMLMSEGWSQR